MRQYVIFILLFLVANVAWTKPSDKYLGVMFGNPTAISFKMMKEVDRGVDFAVGPSIGNVPEFSIHSDYLFYFHEYIYLNDQTPFDLYSGIGGRMEFSDTIQIGPRFPVGLQFKFEDKDAESFLELAPIWDLIGAFGIEISLAIGARYKF